MRVAFIIACAGTLLGLSSSESRAEEAKADDQYVAGIKRGDGFAKSFGVEGALLVAPFLDLGSSLHVVPQSGSTGYALAPFVELHTPFVPKWFNPYVRASLVHLRRPLSGTWGGATGFSFSGGLNWNPWGKISARLGIGAHYLNKLSVVKDDVRLSQPSHGGTFWEAALRYRF